MENAPCTTLTDSDVIKISIATTPEEKKEIYRLRYNVYAEEIGYDLVGADHKNKLLYDELDEWAIILAAHIGSTLIGTSRINIGKLSDFSPDIVEKYHMNKFREFFNEIENPYFAEISKGMILPQYRNSPAMYLLLSKLYDLYCEHQLQFVFVACNFHLIPFWEHYGGVRIDKNSLDHNCGPVANFVVLVDDIQHLRKVGSPLYRTARKRASINNKTVDWFNLEFNHQIATTINSRLVSEDQLWSIICQYLGNAANYNIAILKNLSVSEAKLFLRFCSSIVHCHPGDYIITKGNISQESNILLSGKVQSASGKNILPGQHIGENGLVYRSKHSYNVIALEDTNVLALSFYNFSNFRKRHPDIACKILHSIK